MWYFQFRTIIIFLVTQTIGFQSASRVDHHYALIIKKNYAEYWNIPAFAQLNLSDNFKNLFVRMVAYDPNERPTIEQILFDVWMEEINNLDAEQIDNLENEVRNEFQNREA